MSTLEEEYEKETGFTAFTCHNEVDAPAFIEWLKSQVESARKERDEYREKALEYGQELLDIGLCDSNYESKIRNFIATEREKERGQ